MKKPANIEALNQNLALVNGADRSTDLKFHLEGLQDNAESAFAFAMHLHKIKEKELWREQEGCNSYQDFCERIAEFVPSLAKLKYSPAHLYRLATWAEVQGDVSEPVNESQARELSRVPKAKRAKVLKAAANDGPVTAERIAKVAKGMKAVTEPKEAEFAETDPMGVEIPKAIVGEWSRATSLAKDMLDKLSSIRTTLKEDDAILAEVRGSVDAVNTLYATVKQIIPYAVCPVCQGKKCKTCSKRGFVSKVFYKQSLPDNVK